MVIIYVYDDYNSQGITIIPFGLVIFYILLFLLFTVLLIVLSYEQIQQKIVSLNFSGRMRIDCCASLYMPMMRNVLCE